MKELSIKEKAKAYDNIIEKANKMYSENCEACQICIEELIPELKKSEDERIRTAIIYFISHTPTVPKGIIGKETMIAWLEKRGQTFTKKDVDDAYLKGICDAKHELEKQGEKGTNGNEREIPNSAWSEEDEQYVMDALNLLSFGCSFHGVGEVKDWLKSLRPQNTWKPSDEQITCLYRAADDASSQNSKRNCLSSVH